MSSIFPKDGVFWYQRYVYNPRTGKRDKRVYKSLKTKDRKIGESLQINEDKKWEEIEQKQKINPPRPLEEIKDHYLVIRKEQVSQKRRSELTYRSDEISLKQFVEFITENYGDVDIRDITKTHILEFKDYRESLENVKSPSTISLNLRVIRSFFSFCLERDWIESNPFTKVKIPKSIKREDYPQKNDFQKITSYISKELDRPKLPKEPVVVTDGKFKKKEKLEWFHDNDWFPRLIWLILNTGMRVGETTILKWKPEKDDVGKGHSYSYSFLSDDMKTLTIHFKRGYRIIPVEHLESFFKSIPKTYTKVVNGKEVTVKKKYVFENELTGEPHHTSTVSKLWKKLCVDKKWDTRWTVHSLRHGFSTYLLNSGENLFQVGRYLGHTTKEMIDRYGHTTRDDLVGLVKSLPKS